MLPPLSDEVWIDVTSAQRAEDAGQDVEVPLPPKYGSGDFAKPSYWRARGKLDVPKERFISYPGAEDQEEPSRVIGWAGWGHADRMAALGELWSGHLQGLMTAQGLSEGDLRAWRPEKRGRG